MAHQENYVRKFFEKKHLLTRGPENSSRVLKTTTSEKCHFQTKYPTYVNLNHVTISFDFFENYPPLNESTTDVTIHNLSPFDDYMRS